MNVAPQRMKLIHRRKHHRFPGRPTTHAGIADVGDDDTRPAIHALEQGRTGRNIRAAAYDGVIRHHPKWREEGVHTAPQPTIKAIGLCKNLGQRAV